MKRMISVVIVIACLVAADAGLIGNTIFIRGCSPTGALENCEPFSSVVVEAGDSDTYSFNGADVNVEDDTIIVSRAGNSNLAPFNGFEITGILFDTPLNAQIIGLTLISNTFSTFSDSDVVQIDEQSLEINLGNDGGPGEAIIQIEKNAPPIADIGGVGNGNYTAIIGSDLVLNASGSFDPDPVGGIVSYEWDLNFDGVFEVTMIDPVLTIAAEDLTSTFNLSLGVATLIRVRVTDDVGLDDTATGLLRNGSVTGADSSVCILGVEDSCSEQTQTGLLFLDLEYTAGMSYNEVFAELYPGGSLFGYRYATFDEVVSLLVDAAIPDIPGTTPENAGPVEGLIAFTGSTLEAGTFFEATGSTADPGGLPNSRKFVSIAYSSGQNGFVLTNGSQPDDVTDTSRAHWLVRETDTTDFDGDGFPDYLDNCTEVPNLGQRDTNGDGYGNACDPDFDNNGIVNFLDISAWIPLFNTACGDVDQDINGDGGCNFGDFAIITQFFNLPPGPSGLVP